MVDFQIIQFSTTVALMLTLRLVLCLIICFKILHCTLHCNDLKACSDQVITGQRMWCEGELSCANTIVTTGVGESQDTFSRSCNGDHSCINSIWYNTSWFGSYGAYGISNLIIYNSNTTMNAWLIGYYAAYNTTIYCNHSSDCEITCYGNACVNLSFICDDSSSCNNINGYQTYVEYSENSSGYYHGLNVIDPISSSVVSDPNYDGLECSTSSESICKSSENVVINSDKYNIYCSAVSACENSTISIINTINDASVYCTASSSCAGAFMSVGASLSLDRIDSNSNNKMASNIQKNITVFCGSYYSCANTILSGFNRIYSLGYWAIDGTIIISNPDPDSQTNNNNNNEMNVYIGGASAADGSGAVIYCNKTDICNIYCDASGACTSIIIHCFGNCSIFCDVSIVVYCPTVYYYNYTTEATATAITATTSTAAAITTTTATTTTTTGVHVTKTGPTMQTPITTTTALNTTTDSEDSGGESNNNSEDVTLSETWETAGYICLLTSVFTPFILSIVVSIYHRSNRFYGCDKPNFVAIFACCWNFGDFYSDLIFTFILISQNNKLWYYAMVFLFVPYLVGNVLLMKTIRKWQKSSFYISNYAFKYDTLIIIVSIICGFYTSIELARSKIFYLDMFSLQLKYQDYVDVQKLRFFNIVILELSEFVCFAIFFLFFFRVFSCFNLFSAACIHSSLAGLMVLSLLFVWK